MYTTTSLADLLAHLETRWDGSVFWTPEEGRLALNETLRLWNVLTGRWTRTVLLNSVANQVEYPLGATLLYGKRVAVSSLPLTITSILELDYMQPTWRSETTASGGRVPAVATLWAPISLQRIALWPAIATVGVNNIAVGGCSATPVLEQPGDTIDLGEEDVDLITDDALHVVAFKEGGPRWRATKAYRVALLQAAAEENGRLKANQKYRQLAGLDQRRRMQPGKGIPSAIDDLPRLGGQA